MISNIVTVINVRNWMICERSSINHLHKIKHALSYQHERPTFDTE